MTLYRSEDVREAIRTAIQRGNDMAAWNSGMDRKQIVEEAEALLEELVPVEPDIEACPVDKPHDCKEPCF